MKWVLKWLFAILYHPIMWVLMLIAFIMPFMIYGDVKRIWNYEVPTDNFNAVLLAFIGLWLFLALRNPFLGRLYRRIPVLLPAMQMAFYTSVGLSLAIALLNGWADDGSYSKSLAAGLAAGAFVAVRLLMSLLFWKNPVMPQAASGRGGEGRD
ncbi:hypothetical protein F4V43_14255 [Paenibacillus spiritus]|uniref:Transmembrane protein n=1 Tax=Paenibacillus spiritus TaxID=2496557 RepID=A0A5J5G472_9BACL|nr:hypothetical protein [Paenibacillus spiritus]KAA9001004.1 hypothetical protein F4V43_14255 [Paenibacillus spiritus]